jgi:hypothetical protein
MSASLGLHYQETTIEGYVALGAAIERRPCRLP